MLFGKQVFLPAFEFRSWMFFKNWTKKTRNSFGWGFITCVNGSLMNLSSQFKFEVCVLIMMSCLLGKKANFEAILKSIKRTLSMWKWRGLTLIGRIQIVKSFATPKFMSKASLIYVSNDLIQAANKELFNFIWKGKDKIKRFALINDCIEYGGLKMMDLESMIRAQRIMCVKKYIEDHTRPWKIFLSYYLGKVEGKFILQCHFDCRNLPISMPEFYKACLDACSLLTEKEVHSVWRYNEWICVEKQIHSEWG